MPDGLSRPTSSASPNASGSDSEQTNQPQSSYSAWAARLRAQRLASAGIPAHVGAAASGVSPHNVAAGATTPAAPPLRPRGARTLEELLGSRRDVRQDFARLLSIIGEVSQTVATAHTRGIVHLNLRPSSVLVLEDGKVELTHWGAARVADGEQSEDQSFEGAPRRGGLAIPRPAAVSAFGYQAPEQLRGESVDARTDVFGLGGMLYQLLTGRPPYGSANPHAIRRIVATGHMNEPLQRLDTCGGDPALVGLVKRCISAKPQRRPISATEVAGVLRTVLKRNPMPPTLVFATLTGGIESSELRPPTPTDQEPFLSPIVQPPVRAFPNSGQSRHSFDADPNSADAGPLPAKASIIAPFPPPQTGQLVLLAVVVILVLLFLLVPCAIAILYRLLGPSL